MKWLIDKQVHHHIGDAYDGVNKMMIKSKGVNNLFTYLLSQSGYDVNMLKAKSEVVKNKNNATENHHQ